MKLKDLVEIVVPQPVPAPEYGESINVIKSDDFPSCGLFVSSNSKMKCDKIPLRNALREYDILLQNGSFKVALMANLKERYFARQTQLVLRVKDNAKGAENESRERLAIFIYMYLKSFDGQQALSGIASGRVVNTLSKKSLEDLEVPIEKYDIDEVFNDFHQEQELCRSLYKINHHFDPSVEFREFGICKMCNKMPATHLRTDTWKPFEDGMPMCDICTKEIMF